MKNIINITHFNEIVNGIKAMKADFVLVRGKELLGTDNSCTMLKTYTMNLEIPAEPFTIITKTLSSNFYNSITDTNIIIDTDINKIYCPDNKSFVDGLVHNMIDNNMNDIINKIYYSLNASIIGVNSIDFGEITNDEYFEIIKNLKAPQGAAPYYPKGNSEYSMFLYSGALPVTKSDKVYLKGYDLGKIFISNFTVQKKKMNDVNIYFRFIKIGSNV